MHARIINCLARYHSGMTVIGVTSHLLGGLEAGPQQEIYVWYYIPGREPLSRKLVGPGVGVEENDYVFLLN